MSVETPMFVKTFGYSAERENQARRYWRVAAIAFGAFTLAIFGKSLLGLDPVTPLTHGAGYLILTLIGVSIAYVQGGPMTGELSVLVTRAYGIIVGILVGMTLSGAAVAGVLNPVEMALLTASATLALYTGFAPVTVANANANAE